MNKEEFLAYIDGTIRSVSFEMDDYLSCYPDDNNYGNLYIAQSNLYKMKEIIHEFINQL